MAKETRFYKGPTSDAYKTAWHPTEKQKEIAAKFGLGSPEHLADNQKRGNDYTQEDKYRLQLWMEEVQLGSLDNLDTDEQSFEGAKVAADDFKEFSSQKGHGEFTWNNGTFTPDTITAVTQGITDAGSNWESQTGHSYDHLSQDPYVYEPDADGFDIPRSITHGLGQKFEGKDIGGYITYGGLEGIPDNIAETYENRYIDELWGTDDAVAGTEGYGNLAKDEWKSKHLGETDSALWGLDLVRTETNEVIGTDEHYEHITRGEVDWAHYRDNATFNKAYNELAKDKVGGGTAGELTGQGDVVDQIHRVREVNALLHSIGPEPDLEEHAWAAWHQSDWQFETDSNNYTMGEDGTPGGRLYKGNEMQISFTELLDINSPYYVPPGTSTSFKVGVDPDTGEDIMKEFTSPIEKDLSHLIYDPNKQDQTKDHYSYEYEEKDPETGEMVVKKGQFIEGQTQKISEVSTTPSLPGITWSSGKPKLINPIKLKTAPVIKPISNVTYAQTEGGE